jgi:hypothetical protein
MNLLSTARNFFINVFTSEVIFLSECMIDDTPIDDIAAKEGDS